MVTASADPDTALRRNDAPIKSGFKATYGIVEVNWIGISDHVLRFTFHYFEIDPTRKI